MLDQRPSHAISPKRALLCSRDNALRVATRLFDHEMQPVSVIRTGNPLQPYRISMSPLPDDHVELALVS